MPVNPTNCFICKKTWIGSGPVCNSCQIIVAQVKGKIAAQVKDCSHCHGNHDLGDCLDYKLFLQAQTARAQQYRASRTYRPSPSRMSAQYVKSPRQRYTNLSRGPVMKICSKCKGNYIIESKAGSVCSNCHTVVHNPCRNCSSTSTKGIAGDGMQFVECNDCLFIE